MEMVSEGGIEDDSGVTLKDREFELLLPIGALISSANNKASELGGGFRVDQTGLELIWPTEVADDIGLSPSASKMVRAGSDTYRLLFKPVAPPAKPSYWAALFGKEPPSLVMEYAADDRHLINHTHEAWLVWPWHFDTEDQRSALDTALAVHADLSEALGWFAASQRAVEGSRAELFDAITRQIATRQ
ncbi:hypothetical protein [Ostreiculturibacter nitratireducens]|uniref:hypothetical protein n=1 Tax=Ostreiculturibacter nitratireducens TaxID=3075226 RepID=UPI0031B643CA